MSPPPRSRVPSAALFAAALPGAPALAAASCAKGSLSLVHAGQLTVATDAPAYPPYFEGNKPANGKGFESAVAYAIAKQLGFSAAQVKWTVEPFDSSYAPGPKPFDFDINEISITERAREGGRLLDALLHQPAGDRRGEGLQVPARDDARPAARREVRRAGGHDQPRGGRPPRSIRRTQPQVYNNSNDVVTALRQHGVDAIVVDLATAFYLTSGEIPHGVVVGQFNAPGGDNWGVLLCQALHAHPSASIRRWAKLRCERRRLRRSPSRWMQSGAGVPA